MRKGDIKNSINSMVTKENNQKPGMEKKVLPLVLAAIMLAGPCVSVMAAETQNSTNAVIGHNYKCMDYEVYEYDYTCMDSDFMEYGNWCTTLEFLNFCLPDCWTIRTDADLCDDVHDNIYFQAVNDDCSEAFGIFYNPQSDYANMEEIVDFLEDEGTTAEIIAMNGLYCVSYSNYNCGNDTIKRGLIYILDNGEFYEVRCCCNDVDMEYDFEYNAINILYSVGPLYNLTR